MKNIKRAIAHFILDGKYFWKDLTCEEKQSLYTMIKSEYFEELKESMKESIHNVERAIEDGIYRHSERTTRINEELGLLYELKLEGLMPCFFED